MLVLDAGAFVALERNDRAMWSRLKAQYVVGEPPITHGAIVGQVWRGGSGQQAQLARGMQMVETLPFDLELGRRAGMLLARTRQHDAVDAGLVALARHGDTILTSDPDDIAELVEAAGILVDVVAV